MGGKGEGCPKPGPAPPVIPYEKVPASIRDNPFLRSGYRPPNCSYCRCVGSAVEKNNQRLNIWTSLLGIPFFLFWGVDLLFTNFFHNEQDFRGLTLSTVSAETSGDMFFICSWLGSLVLVNFASTMAHTFSIQNVVYFWRWFQFDVSSFISIAVCQIYGISNYANVLSPGMSWVWIRSALAVPFIFSGFLIYWNKYCPNINKLYKFALGLSCVLVGALPVWYRVLGFSHYSNTWAGALGCLFVGGLIFATLYPERIAAPGALDYDFYSHPSWHLWANMSFVYNTMAYLEDYQRLNGIAKDGYYSATTLIVPVGTVAFLFLRSSALALWSKRVADEHPQIKTS